MVKLEILRGYTGAEGKINAGEFVVVNETRAKEIMAKRGRARYAVDVVRPEPAIESTEKKYSGAQTTGPSASAPLSNGHGPGAPSSASPAAPASRNPNANWLDRFAQQVKGIFGS